jgi:hypothetical protein
MTVRSVTTRSFASAGAIASPGERFGAAALVMALAYYGRHVPLSEMHTATGTGRACGPLIGRPTVRRKSSPDWFESTRGVVPQSI